MTDLTDAIKSIKSKDNLITILNSYNIHLSKENKACCPFHNEKTASFVVYEENGEGKYKCFGCNEGGDIINFIQKQENLSTIEATKEAFKRLGKPFELEGPKLGDFISFIKKNPFEGHNYESTYVYVDANNEPVYMKNKYRNIIDKSKKTFITKSLIKTEKSYKFGDKEHFSSIPKFIYNYPKVKKSIENNHNIYVVEGEKDADSLIRIGFTATTIYSKKWEEAYTEQLGRAKIVFIGDTGIAGEEFKQLVWENLKDVVLSFKIVTLPGLKELGDNKDVTDWLEAGHTKEELLEAIKNGWDWKISDKWKDVFVKENPKTGEKTIIPLRTLDNFELLLEKTGTEVYFNVISREIEANSKTFHAYNLNMLETEIYSYCNKINFRHTAQEIRANLRTIAQKRKVNPFKEYLDSLNGAWDGISRLKAFYDLFKTVEFFNDDLKEIILKRWLLHFLASAYDPKFKGQGILVLKGKQGMGKTTCMEYLIPIEGNWVFLAEQKFIDSRDGIQTITSNQLVELSEFARSAKAVDALKGFITAFEDKYVLKYVATPEAFKRHTVYYATINDDEFLIDDSNRRFWVLDLASIDLEGFKTFDFKQLWAELYHIYHVEGDKKYWLEDDKRELLEQSNQGFKFKGELEGQIELYFDFNSPKRVWMTAAEILEVLGKPYTLTKITRTLKSMRIEQKAINNKKMPRNKYNAMPYPKWWKGKLNDAYKDRLVNLKIVEDDTDNNDMDLLKKENQAIKKLLLQYKEQLLKLENENKELKEAISFYESDANFK